MNPLSIIEQFYEPGSEAYKILVRHSTDVANMAVEIAIKHPELNADIDFIREGAMLHDIGICQTDAPGIACFGSEPYIRHGYLGAEMLRALGLPRHAHVAERHTGTGLTEQDLAMIRHRGIDIPPGIYMPQNIEEEIICYADKFFSKSKLECVKAPDKIRKSLLKYGIEAIERWDKMHLRFSL